MVCLLVVCGFELRLAENVPKKYSLKTYSLERSIIFTLLKTSILCKICSESLILYFAENKALLLKKSHLYILYK